MLSASISLRVSRSHFLVDFRLIVNGDFMAHDILQYILIINGPLLHIILFFDQNDISFDFSFCFAV